MAKNYLVTQQGAPVNNASENLGKGTPLTHAELDNNFFPLYVTAEGTAQASKALILDASGDLNMNNVGRIDNCETVQFHQELDNGSKTTNFNITFDSAQKQMVTLTANTMIITLLNPTSVGNWVIKVVNGGLATITWAATTGSVYWAGGTEPTWTSSGTDLISVYYDGTNFYCAGSLAFS